jgi:membrane-bound lytic murein transglycosylase D
MKLLRTTLLLLLISLLPLNVFAAQELHAIKKKASTSKFYDRALEFFTKKFPEAFEKKIDNSYKYIDTIMTVFKEKNIPLDIAYLPLIESGFSHLSVGSGDAVGLWQFVRGTGQRYGLKIDKYVDERKDPVKSTQAAARYLKDLYGMFGAWDVALAAYNAGEGRVKRMLNGYRSVRLPDFLSRYLAQFMAASTVAQNPEEYGLKTPEDMPDEDAEYIEVKTDKIINLNTIAEQYETTVKIIRELNPALLTNRTPPYPYVLRLPTP